MDGRRDRADPKERSRAGALAGSPTARVVTVFIIRRFMQSVVVFALTLVVFLSINIIGNPVGDQLRNVLNPRLQK